MRRVKTISVCIPEELSEALKRQAWSVGVSVSSYTTMLLSRALRDPGNTAFALEVIDNGEKNQF